MRANEGEIILYNTEDGEVELEIKLDHENQTIWLIQGQIAELFAIKSNTVTEHLKGIYSDNELDELSTTRSYRVVRQEGSREVEREINHYNLKSILAVGYRVRSDRGTQFRRWATDHLNEYLVKGFVMNDKRLKEPGGWDYFDELLERIKDIRASEKRFYQKVRDLVKDTSVDYSKDHPKIKEFFSSIQNKLLFAETGKTAAELIIGRADSNKSNMGLMSFIRQLLEKRFSLRLKSYKKTLMTGLITTIKRELIKERCAMEEHPGKRFWMERKS